MEQEARRGEAGPSAVTLCFFRFDAWRDRLWALTQMGLARRGLRRAPGAGFVKLFGAGSGDGFTPRPDPSLMAVLSTWPDLAAARAGIGATPAYRRLRARADETYALYLEPIAARGEWSRRQPFAPSGGQIGAGPVAALTRATIRPGALLKFWARAPAISKRIGADPNVIFKAGVGEVPWLHQVTFSIWPDAESMAAFARADGPHAAAIAAVRAEGWFAEELYARFAVRAHEGSWRGGDPLAAALRPPAKFAAE